MAVTDSAVEVSERSGVLVGCGSKLEHLDGNYVVAHRSTQPCSECFCSSLGSLSGDTRDRVVQRSQSHSQHRHSSCCYPGKETQEIDRHPAIKRKHADVPKAVEAAGCCAKNSIPRRHTHSQ